MKSVLFGGGRCVWGRRGSWGVFGGRLGSGRGVIGKMIGGLFVGGADGVAPGVGVVGVDVFVLGEGQDLDQGLPEGGEGGGGFGFLLALGLRACNAQRYGWPTRRRVRHLRPSEKVNEHKEARSLERLVDMEVSRRKILKFGIFGEASRRRGVVLNGDSVPRR